MASNIDEHRVSVLSEVKQDSFVVINTEAPQIFELAGQFVRFQTLVKQIYGK